ncbi:MAG: SURF1 family protein [Microbacterium sp.]
MLRWGVYLLIAGGFAVVCAFLSQWQFDRNASRTEQIALVEANYDAEPLTLDELIGSDGVFHADDEWHPVTLHGEYLADQQLLVRNRPHGGTSAFEVLVPFQTDEGRIFIVDRGWVPPGEGDAPDAVPAPPRGQVEVIIRLRSGESAAPGRSAPPGQVATIHLPTIADQIGGDVVTSAYGQLVSEVPSAAALGSFDSPTEDPGPHLSYAIQWILFALMGFVFIGYIIRTEIVKNREDREQAAVREEKQRTRSRERARDEDIEDTLLDAH